MELRAYDVVVTLSVGKSQNYQKLRINYVTATSCVNWDTPSESAECFYLYFTKIRRIIQNACYFLFSTDLNKIFHIKYIIVLAKLS